MIRLVRLIAPTIRRDSAQPKIVAEIIVDAKYSTGRFGLKIAQKYKLSRIKKPASFWPAGLEIEYRFKGSGKTL